MSKYEFNPDWRSPVRDTITRIMEDNDLKYTDVAKRSGLSEQRVWQIIHGDVIYSDDEAAMLRDALGVSTQFWINRQADALKPFDWPNDCHVYWWMQFKMRPKSRKWSVLLVTVMTHDGEEFIEPFEDNNCFSRSIIENMQAKFLPCTSPPLFLTR